RQPAYARRAHDPARGHQTVRLGRGVEVEPGRASGRPRKTSVAVHLDLPHKRQVDHEAAVADAVPSRIVSTPAHGHLELVRPCEAERGRDVLRTETAVDHTRPAIHAALKQRRAASYPSSSGPRPGPDN